MPAGWRRRRVVLLLERAHWKTRVWIDTIFVGDGVESRHSAYLRSRAHTSHRARTLITVRVDNRLDPVDVGSSAHSVTDHTQTNWNGIVGAMELTARPASGIADVDVVSDGAARSFHSGYRSSGERMHPPRRGESSAQKAGAGSGSMWCPSRYYPVTSTADTSVVEIDYPLGDGALLWDEFSPALYTLTVAVQDAEGRELDRRRVRTGVRTIRDAEGRSSL